MSDNIVICWECNKSFDDSCGEKCKDGEWRCEKCLAALSSKASTVDVEALISELIQWMPTYVSAATVGTIVRKHVQPASESDELRQYRQCIKSLCAMAGCTDRELAGWITAHKAMDNGKAERYQKLLERIQNELNGVPGARVALMWIDAALQNKTDK